MTLKNLFFVFAMLFMVFVGILLYYHVVQMPKEIDRQYANARLYQFEKLGDCYGATDDQYLKSEELYCKIEGFKDNMDMCILSEDSYERLERKKDEENKRCDVLYTPLPLYMK